MSKRQERQLLEAGATARRDGRGINTCPHHGMAEEASLQGIAWRLGWAVENAKIKKLRVKSHAITPSDRR